MNPRHILPFLLSLGLAATAVGQQRNVLLIIADDLGTDSLGLYNSSAGANLPPTPNINALKAGAVLHVSTDIGDYARTILLAAMAEPRFAWLAASPDDWRRPHLDRPETRYEAKAIREGRPCYHLRFTRI